jgi:hypothetical protein
MHRLESLAPYPLDLIWHENKSSYLSVRKEQGIIQLRIHRLFYDAPTPVLEALLLYALKRDPQARIVLKQMAHLHFSQNVTLAVPLQSEGKTYNLQEIYKKNQLLIPVEEVSIGWSRLNKTKFRSITFGIYDKQRRQIRINPLLDDPLVPLYFVEFIVYHEMIHALIPTKIDLSGRCSIHSKEFRSQERRFPQYAEAKEWEKTSLTFLKKRHIDGRP